MDKNTDWSEQKLEQPKFIRCNSVGCGFMVDVDKDGFLKKHDNRHRKMCDGTGRHYTFVLEQKA